MTTRKPPGTGNPARQPIPGAVVWTRWQGLGPPKPAKKAPGPIPGGRRPPMVDVYADAPSKDWQRLMDRGSYSFSPANRPVPEQANCHYYRRRR